MRVTPSINKPIVSLMFLLIGMHAMAVVYDLRAKKDPITGKYGYENVGDKYYWWHEAHRLGADKKELNQSQEIQWVIAPQYDNVSKTFSEDLAAVEIDGKVGFIDQCNRFIVAPQYEPVDHLEGFKHGLAVVKRDGKFGFIDKRGNFVFQPEFDDAENFGDDHLAVVKMGNKFGCIDINGDIVVPCEHLAKEIMKNVPVKNKKYRKEKELAQARWNEGYYADFIKSIDNSAAYANKLIRDVSYVVPSPTGKMSVYPDNVIKQLSHGCYLVGKNGKQGIADAWGRTILPPIYTSVRYQKSNRLFIVEEGTSIDGVKRVGLANAAGGWIIPPIFEKISDFKGNTATASIGSYSTRLDVNGSVEISFLENMLKASSKEEGIYYTNRLIGVLPSLAAAHNILGIYYASKMNDLKHAINQFTVAHNLNPDNEEFKANMKAAKSERNNRRWNRVLTGMQVAAAVITLGAVTYSAVSGNGAMAASTSSDIGASGGSSSGKSKVTTKCKRCLGSGKCSTTSGTASKYYCHGSGKCGHCSGSGVYHNLGQSTTCTACKGSGKCKYCKGSGKCSDCGGSGKR